jgi:cysteine desulfurase/selenocysteine lyase
MIMSTIAEYLPAAQTGFDVKRVRGVFPILRTSVHGRPLVYLDNAATAQKPQAVIDALVKYYTEQNANIHRGVHFLSEEATRAYEEVRELARAFLNASSEREIIFTRGATEAINLVASSYGRRNFRRGDEVLITGMEHHSNLVPWQMICEETGATLRVVPITDAGELRMEEFERLLSERTKMVAVTHVSNALGTVNPIKRIVDLAHARNVPVLVDGAQAVPHFPVDIRALGCDFYALSSHKLFGPTGVGILYGKEQLLEAMPPYQGGGDMIRSVTFEKTLFNDLPYKFEAGTPNIADGIAFGAALQYLRTLDWPAVIAYEHGLLSYAERILTAIDGVRIIGTAKEKAGVVSFVLEGVHPHDIGTVVDQSGVAIRTGHHCAQPVMQRFGIPATARASFAFYNTREDADALAHAIRHVKEVFA